MGVVVGDRPAEAGEVAGDGDECLAFAALAVEALPDVVEALLGFPGDRDRFGGLVLLAALGAGALAGRAAVVPGRLDQEPACVAGAGLGVEPCRRVWPELCSEGTSAR